MKRLTLLLSTALMGALLSAVSAHSRQPADDSNTEPVRLRVDVDRAILPAETTEKAVIKIALDGMRLPRRELRPPVNLALVIDRSGSMAGDKIQNAREAALEAVRRLGPDDIVSLIAYDTNVQTLVSAQRVGNGRRLEQAIRGLEVGGNTALYGGVTRGASEVRKNLEDRRYVNRVILLSDGLANVGPSSAEELGRLGTSLMKEGISVTTIGLGLGFNEDLMTRLALRSDGNTYFVENSSDLSRIFAAELGDVLNVVARRVVIEIEFPEGVRPIMFVGRDGSIRGQKAELTLNQLYGGQEKFALVEVEVSPSRSGAEREIARARVSYEDALNQRTTTLTAKRTVQFSSSSAAVIGSADHKVQADYALNVMAVAKDEAVALVDANRRDEAAARLRVRSEQFKAMGQVYQNREVQSMAAAAAPEADRLEKEGLTNAERKIYRADNAQVRAQQSSGGGRP
ncbi:MAG TPA: VWA domain-containing protein [Opitutaceae bacterium]|nr:VWA domain-containing protein [Opitutaceae bacterium]